MQLQDLVSFRKDLLFNGAVQISWLEDDTEQAENAARHFVFHGPDYHGVKSADFGSDKRDVIDTASFTLEIIENLNRPHAEKAPIAMGIAGYGTGKSHLGVTLASLLSNPDYNSSKVSNSIINNMRLADEDICVKVQHYLNRTKKPYLVVAINGMKDFDLNNEISKQIIKTLNANGHDTSCFDNLRPRYESAKNFVSNFYSAIKEDIQEWFGSMPIDELINRLEHQEEAAFKKVNHIYERKMGGSIVATGSESLQDFISLTNSEFCGDGKPYAGIFIIFDEFGRYLEFSVQKPHIAGSGALQQLYEAVQNNSERVFLLCFIQYELNAYISRIAPELRTDLKRYVTRFDGAPRFYLSTNLETLIANLLEKKSETLLKSFLEHTPDSPLYIQTNILRWFPELRDNALWSSNERFEKTIFKGCCPLHPLSTWLLCKLSSTGKSLQQRSALSLLADVFDKFGEHDLQEGELILPVQLCNEALISEFLTSEKSGRQGAFTYSFEAVMHKYGQVFENRHVNTLKAILIALKIGNFKVDSRKDYYSFLSMFAGLAERQLVATIEELEKEYAVLQWNAQLNQHEIIGDAAPKREFEEYLEEQLRRIDSGTRADIFSDNFKAWSDDLTWSTDFGADNNITTSDWHYNIYYTNVNGLEKVLHEAAIKWRNAENPDENKGQMVYCYVGPESSLDDIKNNAKIWLQDALQSIGCEWVKGAPIAVLFLDDSEGSLGEKVAQYWVLEKQMNDDTANKYAHFIDDKKQTLWQEIEDRFGELEKEKKFVFATDKNIDGGRTKKILHNLFQAIYPEVIPFPVDGFSTARGNAAKDCSLFTRNLFLDKMDREAIAALNTQQRNRADKLFNKCWEVLCEDGSIRHKPLHPKLRGVIDLIEKVLEGSEKSREEGEFMNLGQIVEMLILPPYGCNIASAGLLLAMFIGKRKSEFNLLLEKESVNIDEWLSKAIPKNFLEMEVLHKTVVLKVTPDQQNEWEKLLDEWEAEKTYRGKVKYMQKALELMERMPVPQDELNRFFHYKEKTEAIKKMLEENEKRILEGTEKIEKGENNNNLARLAMGASILKKEYDQMLKEVEFWEQDEIQDIESDISKSRIKIKELLPEWLKEQRITNIEELSKFKETMLNTAKYLESLHLPEEVQVLKEYVEKVEKNINEIERVKRTAQDINSMVMQNSVSNTVTISTLNNWLDQIEYYRKQLKVAEDYRVMVEDDLEIAHNQLNDFEEKCCQQIKQYQERMTKVYNIATIRSKSDIEHWRKEIAALININEDNPKDLDDLQLVQQQIELLAEHYFRLDDENMSNAELSDMVKACVKEVEDNFTGDVPPLDTEAIYQSILDNLLEKRNRLAKEWMIRNMVSVNAVMESNASKVMDIKRRMHNAPRYLSDYQSKEVEEIVNACEKRLDELELEGLLEKFYSMNEENKRRFLDKIMPYVKK